MRRERCKFCNDFDTMNQVVCYLPRENGSATAVPINYCPNCGAKMDTEPPEDMESEGETE